MELLEREQCLSDLTEWLKAAVDGDGCIALVSGEAGIGKTSLLREFSKRQRLARVLWGACDALFTPRPLAPVHDIARQAQGALLSAVGSDATRDQIFTAVLDELERGPASLIVFEDVHWADEATLDLLKFLSRRIQRTSALLAITYRDDEVGARHPLRYVIGDIPRTAARRLPLFPLTQPAVAQLAQEAGRPLKDLFSITGGNPLFVTEALAGNAESVPVTVKDAVLARAARLSPVAREIAELVSVVPGKAEAWLLEAAALRADGALGAAGAGTLSAADAGTVGAAGAGALGAADVGALGAWFDAALDSCLAIGMVRGDDGSLAFRHELARRAFEDALSPARAQSLHAKVLSILSKRSDTSLARLAHHADGARSAQDVVRYAPLAGSHAASVGAHREAAAHYRLALRHAAALPPNERASLHEHYSYECYLTDQIEESIEARRAALELWSNTGERLKEGDTLRWLSRLSWFTGRRPDAERYATEAVKTLDPLPPGPELAMAYSNRSQLDMLAHEVDSSIHWAERTIGLAESLGRSDILSHALNNLGTSKLIKEDATGWDDLERSLKIALADNHHEHAARAFTNLSSTAVSIRQYERATRYLRDGIQYCDEQDLDSWRLYMLSWRARARFERVDWNGASEDAEAVLRDSRTAAISRITALTVLGHMRIRRGDPDSSSPLEEARQLSTDIQETQRIGPLAYAFAEAAWIEGDRETVIREVQSAYELAREQRDPWIKGMLAVSLWRADALNDTPSDLAEPYALEVAGDWQGAARVWSEMGCTFDQANMLAWYGGEGEQRQALVMFEQLGAAPSAQALRKQMRAQGVQGIPRGTRASTRLDPHGLTKREAEILALVSDGLRNSAIAKKLFLSTKTVDHHVSAILTKLGVPSRAEAAAMARKMSKS